MSALEIVSTLFCGSLAAGFLGALTGLGGGMIIVPLMVLFLHIDIHYAIGTSLMGVIATSTAASTAYIKDGYTNIRIGLFLGTATSVGAISGVFFGSLMPASLLALIFGCVLIGASISSFFANRNDVLNVPPNKIAIALQLEGSYPADNVKRVYHVQGVILGYIIMFIAGVFSGALGIGSGVFNVLAMDKIMHLPFKVSTTTSNFLIGITAAASAGLYLHLGYIDPFLTVPVVLGIAGGAFLGAKTLPKSKTSTLRYLFASLLMIIALQLIYKGLTHA